MGWFDKSRNFGSASDILSRATYIVVAMCVMAVGAVPVNAGTWPVTSQSYNSTFGIRNMSSSADFHDGIDIHASDGSDVKAEEGGDLMFYSAISGFGYVCIIGTPSGVVTQYVKVQSIADNFVINRSEPADIDEASITAHFYINPATWDNWYVFEWYADRRSNPEVYIRSDDIRPECNCTAPSTEIKLSSDMPTVAVECKEEVDGRYRHKLIWTNR